jgi:hypothetical protein
VEKLCNLSLPSAFLKSTLYCNWYLSFRSSILTLETPVSSIDLIASPIQTSFNFPLYELVDFSTRSSINSWNYSFVGQPPGSSPVVSSSLRDGRVQQEIVLNVPKSAPVEISATILTPSIFFDSPIASIAFQVRDANLNVATNPIQILVSVDGFNGSCISDAQTGICVTSVSISNLYSRLLQVSYSSNITGPRAGTYSLGSIQLLGPSVVITWSNTVVAIYPSRKIYAGETISIPVYAYFPDTVGSFSVVVRSASASLKLVNLVIGDSSLYFSVVSVNSSVGIISAVPQLPLLQRTSPPLTLGTQQPQFLFNATFTAPLVGSYNIVMDVVQLFLVRGLAPANYSNGNTSRVVAFGKRSGLFQNNIGIVNFRDNNPVAFFGSVIGGVGEIVNHLPLLSSPSTLAYPMTVFGVVLFPTVRIITNLSYFPGIVCNSSNSQVLQVTSNCSHIIVSRNSTSGSPRVNISFGLSYLSSGPSGTMPVRVWVAIFESLNKKMQFGTLSQVSGFICMPEYPMRSKLQLSASFFAGNPLSSATPIASFEADVTSLVLSALNSTTPSVAVIDLSSATIVGKSPGSATFVYRDFFFGMIVSASTIGVQGSLVVNLVSKINTSVIYTPSGVTVNAVAISSSFDRDDTALAVLVSALLPNSPSPFRLEIPIASIQLVLTNLSGLALTSYDVLIANSSRIPRAYVQTGTVSALWPSCATPYTGTTSLSVSISEAIRLDVQLSSSQVTLGGDPLTFLGFVTVSQVLSATLVFPSYSRSVLTDTQFFISPATTGGSSFVSLSTPFVGDFLFSASSNSTGTQAFTAKYLRENVTTSIAVTFVRATGLALVVSDESNNEMTEFRQLGFSGQFQTGLTSTLLSLSDGSSHVVSADWLTVPSVGPCLILSVRALSVSPSMTANCTSSFQAYFHGLWANRTISVLSTPPLFPTQWLGFGVAEVPFSVTVVIDPVTPFLLSSARFLFSFSVLFPPNNSLNVKLTKFSIYSGMFNFSVSSSAIDFDTETGLITVVSSSPIAVQLTISVIGSSMSTSLAFYCNLRPALNDIDLGYALGPPVPPAPVNSSITVPVSTYVTFPIVSYALKVRRSLRSTASSSFSCPPAFSRSLSDQLRPDLLAFHQGIFPGMVVKLQLQHLAARQLFGSHLRHCAWHQLSYGLWNTGMP